MVAAVTLYYRSQNNQIILSGDTYALRDHIKTLGGRFIGQTKSWLLPDTIAVRAQIAKWGGIDPQGAAPLSSPERQVGRWDGENGESPLPEAAPAVLLEEPGVQAGQPLVSSAESLSVKQLVDRVQALVQRAFAQPVWIIGEIQNMGVRPKGIFLSLAEAKDGVALTSTVSVNATIWSNAVQSLLVTHGKETLAALLVDGMKVRVLCSVGFYRDRGSISLNIMAIDPSYTKGAMALAREELLRELRKSGLATKNAATPLAAFPLKIGLISAEGSRAKSDFLDQLQLYGYPGKVVFYAAQMQGEALLVEVTGGISTLCAMCCDLIVLTRGGGSTADLRWFDSPQIAYAIAASPIPIIAAIGHHDDRSVAEEISFRQEKTPTAAADFIIHHLRKTDMRLDEAIKSMSRTMDERINDARQRSQYMLAQMQLCVSQRLMAARDRLFKLQSAVGGLCHTHVLQATRALSTLATALLVAANARLALRHADAARQGFALYHACQQRLLHFSHYFEVIDNLLGAHDPRTLLRRGFTQLKGKGGILKSVAAVVPGERLTARLIDGSLVLLVSQIMENDQPDPQNNKDQ